VGCGPGKHDRAEERNTRWLCALKNCKPRRFVYSPIMFLLPQTNIILRGRFMSAGGRKKAPNKDSISPLGWQAAVKGIYGSTAVRHSTLREREREKQEAQGEDKCNKRCGGSRRKALCQRQGAIKAHSAAAGSAPAQRSPPVTAGEGAGGREGSPHSPLRTARRRLPERDPAGVPGPRGTP